MTAIIPFTFDEQPVRISDRNGQPWFVAADVCAVLGISSHRDAVARLDDDERGSVLLDTLGGEQAHSAINESGLYKLVLRSRKEAAKRFTKWLTSEVLPAIRRTGHYGSPSPTLDLRDPATLQALLADLTGLSLDANARLARLAPKVEAMERLEEAEGSLCITDAAKALSVPPRRLFAWLEANRWIYRRNEAGHWVAFSAKLEARLLEHKGTTIQRRFKPDKWVEQVVVTPKGLARLAELKAGN